MRKVLNRPSLLLLAPQFRHLHWKTCHYRQLLKVIHAITCISKPFRDSCIFPLHRLPAVKSKVRPLAKIR